MHITEQRLDGCERVVWGSDESVGYRGLVVVDSTRLGPAVGGVRLLPYPSDAAALTDATRLARGMAYKNALAGLPLGGGKSVIIARDGDGVDRTALLHAHGRLINALGGQYTGGCDVGTNSADMVVLREVTDHVHGLPGRAGEPAPYTAQGVVHAMRAAAHHLWGHDTLAGRRVAIQGCGQVGSALARQLHALGVDLVLTDIDPTRRDVLVTECDALPCDTGSLFGVTADILAPCALGGILSDETIPRLRVKTVVGAANNQLLTAEDGDRLATRGIQYVPDYVANAGGVINGAVETLGWTRDEATRCIGRIYGTVLAVLAIAEESKQPANRCADLLAEQRILSGQPATT